MVLLWTQYYASGVPMAGSTGRDQQPYLYNGKEFVEAHGLNEYDSQARRYYATIMRTTTMDPLAEKYPSISPYAYCNWNPVKYIDPEGCDTFNICKQNELITCIPNHGNDIVRFVDSNGNVKKGADGNFLEVSFKENSISLMDGISGFIVQGDEAGTNLFEFLAESGAMIEWTQLMSGEARTGVNYISTSWDRKHNSSTSHVINKYFRDNVILREYIHNHPVDAIGVPSGMHDRVNKTTGLLEKAGTWGDIGVRNNI